MRFSAAVRWTRRSASIFETLAIIASFVARSIVVIEDEAQSESPQNITKTPPSVPAIAL
jgi:hypothetical protein